MTYWLLGGEEGLEADGVGLVFAQADTSPGDGPVLVVVTRMLSPLPLTFDGLALAEP